MFNITGILKTKLKEQQVSEKFKKREFVLTDTSSQYPQHIAFQLVQDKCSLIENFAEGQEIKVYFNLRGREWTSPQGEVKYFNTLDAWKIEGQAVQNNAPVSGSTPADTAMPAETFAPASADDDLPF